MPISRYQNSTIVKNDEQSYRELLKEKGLSHVIHYVPQNLKYPSEEQLNDLATVSHIWSVGSRFAKLAAVHYNDARYWWVIAFFNNLPTDHHVKPGDKILIPMPLNSILAVIMEK